MIRNFMGAAPTSVGDVKTTGVSYEGQDVFGCILGEEGADLRHAKPWASHSAESPADATEWRPSADSWMTPIQ